MADAEAKRSSGGLARLVLWFVIAALFAAVWWLASERNQRHFHVAAQNGAVQIERGRFFPTGTGTSDEKAYQSIAIPTGEKAPGEQEFDDQNTLDRYLFDLLAVWAQDLAKKGDTHSAADLVARASQLPGITYGQTQSLQGLSADLAWDDAQIDLKTAAAAVESARKKLSAVQAGKGSHALDAAALDQALQPIQKSLENSGKQGR
jgi:hypothetical protein